MVRHTDSATWDCRVRNITVSVDDETHRLARVRAAQLDTSVSALVRGYLQSLVADGGTVAATNSGDGENPEIAQRRKRLNSVVEAITANGGGLRMVNNLPRAGLYDRVSTETTVEEPFS